jgi:transcriptional regulator with XRE-family HTH domain
MNHEEVKRRLLGDPEVRRVYENPPLPLAAARAVVERRKELGMTQKELAEKIGSSQAQVWRIESGQFNPTLKTLSKLEEALDVKLVPVEGVPEGSDFAPTPSEQLEEWIEFGVVSMDEESQRIVSETLEGKELTKMVRRIQPFVEELEVDEYVEIKLKPISESEPSETAGANRGSHRNRLELAVTV